MSEKIVTRPSTKEYREGWERVFRRKKPSDGETFCSKTDKSVQMVRVTK